MYGILPRHATGEPTEWPTWDWNRNPVTAGPFVVTEWNSGDTIAMERNPNYYLEGQPYLDRLIFKVVPDPAPQMAMMMQGEAQVQLWPGADKDVYDVQTEGVATLQEIPGPWNMALRFNLSQPFDDDPGPDRPIPSWATCGCARPSPTPSTTTPSSTTSIRACRPPPAPSPTAGIAATSPAPTISSDGQGACWTRPAG